MQEQIEKRRKNRIIMSRRYSDTRFRRKKTGSSHDQNSDEYLIFFSSKERAADGGMKAVDFEDAGCFQNELLDQSMKLAIGNDTRQIRELIVTRALYSAFIPQEESEEKIDSDEEYNLEEIAEAWKDEE